MARPGFSQHPKYKRLVYELGEPPPHVRGYLEFLWEVGYATCDPYIGDSIDVALAAQYPGDHQKLTKALLAVRLIDEVAPGKYQIHDLMENAPDYVLTRLRVRRYREREKQAEMGADDGIPPEECNGNVTVTLQSRDGNGLPTLPFPSQPNPNQEEYPPNPPSGGSGTEKPAEQNPPTKNDAITPSRRRKREQQSPAEIPPELDTTEFRRAWEEWRQHRREKKKPLTPTSERKQLAELAGWGPARAIRAIEHTITKGWVGIFEPEQKRGANRNGQPNRPRDGYRFTPPTVEGPSSGASTGDPS